MPSVTAFQTNFSAGEISPKLFARVDVSKYPNAAYEVQNLIVQRFGGAKKRGGTEFIEEVKDSADETRLIPFIFSVTQAYMLEFGDLYIRIYTNGGRVENPPGTPVEVVSPYTSAQLFDLQFAQSADVLYITHPDHPPMEFTRTSATAFTIEEIEFEDGPYLELNTSATTLTPASFGSITPTMTSNSAPSGTVSSSGSLGNEWQVFDRNPETSGAFDTGAVGYVQYQQAGGAQVVADAYYIIAPSNDSESKTPSAWQFQGSNNGATWITLDTRKGETGWADGETRFYEFQNGTAYEYYRFSFQGGGGDGAANTELAELGIHRKATDQTPFNLTASAVTGINDGVGFVASDVGRPIRLLGSDGRWRWAKIIARTSSTVVTIQLYDHALPDLSPIINWRMGAWSDTTGWPGSVGFFTGRLCFARTATQPQTVWMSVVDDFTNFAISDPLQDDDAITATIASDSLNEIKWIAEGTDLFVGTTAAIRTIGATTSTSAFSPTNIKQKRETNYGASDVQPVRVGQTALYSGYYRKDIREIAYSFEFNGYVSTDLSILSEHIPALRIKQIAYAQSPDSIVWGVTDTGELFGMTYERDQEVIAFHEHALGGANSVESVATIPGTEGDETWLVVNRTIGGTTQRYIERLSEGLSDTGAKAAATFLDCHLTYSGVLTTTLTGLSHLNGEQVYVWSGTKQGPFTVSAGSITLTTGVTQACVGYAYTSALETLSPEAAARGGTAQTRLGRISEVFLRLNRSMNGKCGPHDGTLETLDYTKSADNEGNFGTGTDLYTGDVRVPISMDWNRQKRIRVEHSEPSPFHVLGLITEIRVSG
jgi:hypothetical protein